MNGQEPKCPCIDCITMPICKSLLNKNNNYNLWKLRDRCQILKDYLVGIIGDRKTYYLNRGNTTLDYFEGINQKDNKK